MEKQRRVTYLPGLVVSIESTNLKELRRKKGIEKKALKVKNLEKGAGSTSTKKSRSSCSAAGRRPVKVGVRFSRI